MSDTTMTPSEAAQLVEADKQHRVKMAAEAIQRALADYNCDLVPVPTITPQGTIAAILQLVAK